MLSLLAVLLVLQSGPGDWVRAGLAAEEAGHYGEAVSWYARVAEEAPRSYASRRSAVRLRELQAFSDHDFAPYRRYQAILRHYAAWGSERAFAEARAIVAEFPEAAITPHVLFWIGNELAEARGDYDAALTAYRDIAERFPQHELAPRSLDMMGRVYEQRSQFRRAMEVYAELEAKYPNANSPEVFARRRAIVAQGRLRALLTDAAAWTLGAAAIAYLAVGGWRVRWKSFLEHARGKVAFSVALGIPPAAFLWWYDGIWSPSLTLLSLAFAGYSLILASLRARSAAPTPFWVAAGERILFGVLCPLSILVRIVARYQLWEAFGL